MNTFEVLNRAADLIEERGWTSGVGAMSAAPDAQLCMEGAIAATTGLGIRRTPDGPRFSYPEVTCPAYRAVADYLKLSLKRRVYDWNDDLGRTAAEVIEVLRACAVIESARERQAVTA